MFHSAFEKDAEKVVLLVVKGLIQIFVKFRAEKVLRTFLSPNILLMRGIKYWLQKQLCSFENERLIHSITQFGSLFLKKYHKVHVSSPQCMHAPEVSKRHAENVGYCFLLMNTGIYLRKGAGVSKHSWKKVMQLLWDWKMLNMELNMILIILSRH